MDIREKLVELLESINAYAEENLGFDKASGGELIDFHGAEYIADHLLANGVTVQECKVGDTIFEVDGEHGVVKHEVCEVCTVYNTVATDDKGMEWGDYWTTDDIGNSFKTRGEAEACLPQPPKGE